MDRRDVIDWSIVLLLLIVLGAMPGCRTQNSPVLTLEGCTGVTVNLSVSGAADGQGKSVPFDVARGLKMSGLPGVTP